jgi:hypothetical protein
MDDRNSLVQATPVTPAQSTHPLAVLGIIIGGVLALVFLVAGLVAAHAQFMAGATFIAYIMIGLAIVGIPGSVIVAAWMLYQNHRREARIKEMEIKRAEAQIKREDELNRARVEYIAVQNEVLRRTIAFDERGNAGLIDVYTGQVQQLRGFAPEFPSLTSYHNAPRVTSVSEEQAPTSPALLDRTLPSIESFYQAIPYNSLQVGMGIEAASGKLVLAPIRQSTHFKLIGGSGMGKSCVSAAMLDIAMARNDPDHLHIGLLDLEHNTSRLFENAPHIAEIGPKRQRLIGRDPDEVAQKLKLLQWELTRRAQLGEEYCRTHEPILLVYVEEMLALKYEVVDAKLNKEMLAAINILGVRARKYGIFLLACMQTDYSDKSTREAMAQFRTRGGFAIDPDTARASGFFNNDLIKQNFADGRSGQYVLEKPGFSGLVLAPEYDVALKLEQLAAPSPAATASAPIRLRALPAEAAYVDAEGDTEGAIEAAQELPLRRASQADGSTFTVQEQRFISKFMQEGMGIGQIVSSEFTNAKGEPLTGGEAYKQRSKDVQNVIRRYMDTREVS